MYSFKWREGALRKVNSFAEVIELENVCAALCARKIDFGRADFGKALTLQIFAEAARNTLLNFENSALLGVAQRNGAVVKVDRKLAVNLLFGNNHGRNSRGRGQNFYIVNLQFEALAAVACLAFYNLARNFCRSLLDNAVVKAEVGKFGRINALNELSRGA